jgi:isoleucyl-tRNA synthetase
MGADVMRWQYCAQPPDRNLLFGYGPAHEIKRRILTLWNSVSFLVTYGEIERFEPRYADLETGPSGTALQPLDRWLLARAQAFLREAEAAYERYLTIDVMRAFEAFVDDLSNWYIRRSRRRFWEEADEAAFRTLWYALVQSLRAVGPIVPFLTEHLWQVLVAPVAGAPASIFLAGWPATVAELEDEALLAEFAQVRQVVELGRRARNDVNIALRQPLRRAFARGAPLAVAHADEIRDELRVQEIRFDTGPVARVSLKPNLPVLGPRLGPKLRDVRAALEAGDAEELGDGRLRVAGVELGPDDVIRGERVAVEGWAIADEGDVSVAIDTAIDDELRLEGRALDLIRTIQRMRKEQGFEITDRIVIRHDGEHADVFAAHGERIANETLAVAVERSDGEPLAIAKASGA